MDGVAARSSSIQLSGIESFSIVTISSISKDFILEFVLFARKTTTDVRLQMSDL